MSRCETKLNAFTENSLFYKVMKTYLEHAEDEGILGVGEYDDEEMSVEYVEETLDVDDLVKLAKSLHKVLKAVAEEIQDEGLNDSVCHFEGYVEYLNGGDFVNYEINITLSDATLAVSPNYIYAGRNIGDKTYDEFCGAFEYYCPRIRDLITETQFSRAEEVNITYSQVFCDCEPAVGNPKSIYNHVPAGTVMNINDTLIQYFIDNNLPYDDTTLSKLSADDVFAIMSGTYGKDGFEESDADEDDEWDEDDDEV